MYMYMYMYMYVCMYVCMYVRLKISKNPTLPAFTFNIIYLYMLCRFHYPTSSG